MNYVLYWIFGRVVDANAITWIVTIVSVLLGSMPSGPTGISGQS